MKLEDLLRHIADNVEVGVVWCDGLCSADSILNISEAVTKHASIELKPKTRTLNGFEVPAPMSDKPKNGIKVFYPEIATEILFDSVVWVNDESDNRIFTRKICFSTPEAAIANAKAMLGIDPNQKVQEALNV